MKQTEVSPVSAAARPRAPYTHGHKAAKSTPKPQWKVLGDLVTGMRYLPINAGAVATLRALLSCRMDSGTIVYAGNRSLAKRADGMQERTLTRHLSHLCKTGFLVRKNSPNGKRFAKKRTQGKVEVFGIDLAPLFERATELAILARRAEEEDRLIAHMRDTLSELRYLLQENDLAPDLVEDLSLQRRRKANLPVMRSLEVKARSLLEDAGISILCTTPEEIPVTYADDLSVNDSQNVCHIQTHPHRESQPRALHETPSCTSARPYFELGLMKEERPRLSEQSMASREDVCRYADDVLAGFRAKLAGNFPVQSAGASEASAGEIAAKGAVRPAISEAPAEHAPIAVEQDQDKGGDRDKSVFRRSQSRRVTGKAPASRADLSVDAILAACPTACSLETNHPRSWSELVAFAWRIGGWLGFPAELMAEACASLGREGLAVTLLGLCERHEKLRQPAAYLRSVMRRPEFQPATLLGLA